MIAKVLEWTPTRRTAWSSTCPADLLPDWAIATSMRVSARMIRLWIDTGAWPLPRAVVATTLYFQSLDVER
jgi:hypothetical protein